MLSKPATKLLSLLTGIVLVVAACAPAEDADNGDTLGDGELREVHLGQAGLGATFTEVYIAQAKGYFEDEGLYVPEIPALGGNVSAALISGDIDFGMGVGGVDVLLEEAADIHETVVVEVFTNPTARQVIVSQELVDAHGVSKDDPLEQRLAILEDTTFGALGPGASTDIMMQAVAQAGGFTRDNIDAVFIEGGPMGMLGSVGTRLDAFMWNPPFGPMAEHEGVGVGLVALTELDLYQFPELTLTARRDMVENEPEVVEAVVRAIRRGKQFMHENPEEAFEILQPLFEGFPTDVLQEAFDLLLPVTAVDDRMTQEEWERLLHLMKVTGHLPEDFQIDTSEGYFWTNEFIDRALADL